MFKHFSFEYFPVWGDDSQSHCLVHWVWLPKGTTYFWGVGPPLGGLSQI